MPALMKYTSNILLSHQYFLPIIIQLIKYASYYRPTKATSALAKLGYSTVSQMNWTHSLTACFNQSLSGFVYVAMDIIQTVHINDAKGHRIANSASSTKS